MRAFTKVPFDFDIFSPLTVRKPWTKILFGCAKPTAWSIPGQKRQWKRMMSFPMKW